MRQNHWVLDLNQSNHMFMSFISLSLPIKFGSYRSLYFQIYKLIFYILNKVLNEHIIFFVLDFMNPRNLPKTK